jgi:hypothetical protein
MASTIWDYLPSWTSQTSSAAPAAPQTAARNTVKGRRISVVEGASKAAPPKNDAQVEAKEKSLVQMVMAVTMIGLGILLFFTFYHVFAFIGVGGSCYKLYEWINPPTEDDPDGSSKKKTAEKVASVPKSPLNQSADTSLNMSTGSPDIVSGSPLTDPNKDKDRFSV